MPDEIRGGPRIMDDLVLLDRSSHHRGQRLGQCQGELLRKRVAEFRALCQKHEVTELELPDRARHITTTLNVLWQHWLAEARTEAAAAQVSTASLMAITYPPEKVQPALLPKRANDSTAFGASCNVACARALFMRNCDGPDIVHHAVSRAAAPGSLAHVALCEAADIGIKAFVNEAGLAGTFYIGPQVNDFTLTAIQPALVLRHLCERANSCAAALAEFEALHKRLNPGTPDRRGVCYLFADTSGEVLLLEATASRYHHSMAKDALLITTNKFLLGDIPRPRLEPFRERCLRVFVTASPLDHGRALAAARLDQRSGGEKGVCDVDTRASFIAALGAGGRPSFALVTLGSPLCNLAVPLFPRLGAPAGMVNGSFYEKAFRSIDPDGARSAARAEYEKTLLSRLAAIGPSSSDESLAAITSELCALARQYLETPSPSGQAAAG